MDSLSVPAWTRDMLAEVQQIPGVKIVLLLLPSPDANQEKPRMTGRWRRVIGTLVRHRGQLAYQFWNHCDRAAFRVSPDAFRKVDCDKLFSTCGRLSVKSVGEDGGVGLSDGAMDAIRCSQPDVILQLGSVCLPDVVMALPRMGVWSLQHGEREAREEEGPGGWEVLCGDPVTYSTLRAWKGRTECAAILFASATATDRCSITRNRNRCYWKASQFIPRKLREYISFPPSAWPPPEACNDAFRNTVAVPPYGNIAALSGIVQIALRTIGLRIREFLTPRQWFCAFGFQKNAAGGYHDFAQFHHMVPPKGRFWADPFPACMDGKHYVFFEEYVYAVKRARIVVSEVAADGRFSEPRVALERPYHLSYPQVFCWNDQWYMIPESVANRTIELWRCAGPPDRWEFDRNLMENVQAVDSTIVEIAGRFWMFTCIVADEHLPCDELFLFWADSPIGPWQPHRRNPVVSDARCARPAGRPYFQDGKWLRPAQDCTGTYGRRIEVREIVRLTPDDYHERPGWKIEPNWSAGLTATHTFNSVDDLTVIDGCRRKCRGF